MPPTRRHTDPEYRPRSFARPEIDTTIADAVAAHERHTPEGLGECWEILGKLPLPGRKDEDPA